MTASINLVPPEVWSQILQYFSTRELAYVCGLHRAFFERLMALKYGDVRIGSNLDYRVLHALANVAVSNRVQSMTMDTLTFKPHLSMERWFQSCFRVRPADAPPTTTHIIAFPALHTLSLSIGTRYFYLRFLSSQTRGAGRSLVDSTRLWPALLSSPGLTTLTLSLPLEVYRDALIPLDTLHLPALASLEVGVWCCFPSTDYNAILRGAVAPFVVRHAGSLTHLGVDVQEGHFTAKMPFYYTAKVLFEALKGVAFERLESVSVTEPLLTPSQTDLGPLDAFLARHSKQLRALKLHMPHALVHHPWAVEHRRRPYVARFGEEDVRRGMSLLFPSTTTSVDDTTGLISDASPSATQFPNLDTLNVALMHDGPNLGAISAAQPLDGHSKCSVPLVISLLTRSLPQQTARLTKLYMDEARLSPSDALAILGCTPSLQTSLREVSLFVAYLQPSFLRKLERLLPCVNSLSLKVHDDFRADPRGAPPPPTSSSPYPSSSSSPMDVLEAQLRTLYRFEAWESLTKLRITFTGRVVYGRVMMPKDVPDVEVVRAVFPNVRELEYGYAGRDERGRGGGRDDDEFKALGPYDWLTISMKNLES